MARDPSYIVNMLWVNDKIVMLGVWSILKQFRSGCIIIGQSCSVFFQAMENFSWNIRVLKGQADLLNQAKKESQEYLRQVSQFSFNGDNNHHLRICCLTFLFFFFEKGHEIAKWYLALLIVYISLHQAYIISTPELKARKAISRTHWPNFILFCILPQYIIFMIFLMKYFTSTVINFGVCPS